MARRKRHTAEQIVNNLRLAEVELGRGKHQLRTPTHMARSALLGFLGGLWLVLVGVQHRARSALLETGG